jgi:hypothetical protein
MSPATKVDDWVECCAQSRMESSSIVWLSTLEKRSSLKLYNGAEDYMHLIASLCWQLLHHIEPLAIAFKFNSTFSAWKLEAYISNDHTLPTKRNSVERWNFSQTKTRKWIPRAHNLFFKVHRKQEGTWFEDLENHQEEKERTPQRYLSLSS